MASAACIKIEGVPVEFRVATILEAMMALFPIPEIITLPLECLIHSTALEKSSFKREPKWEIAAASVSMVFFAMANIALVSLKVI
tara:strand:- start:1817 stop:2071 length:255 start_codon:yes stop_codon:yes gene_type:complete